MGASYSQESESRAYEEPNNAGVQSYNTEHKEAQITNEVPKPNNFGAIEKGAVIPIQKFSEEKPNQNSKKYWVDSKSGKNCFTLFARDLLITWAEDIRHWHWHTLEESSNDNIPVAELLNVCWLEVHGKFNTAKLSPGTLYSVVFIVRLTETAYGWKVPVNLRLVLPDGSKQEHKENLLDRPREKWIEIPAGEFRTAAKNTGEMEFSLYEYAGGNWKRGLLIKGVGIWPKA